jgi:FdhD protein
VRSARSTTQLVSAQKVRDISTNVDGVRYVPEEVPIAISYGGSSHAVLMGTPDDLVDFAIGFSLTEGIITHLEQIHSIDVVEGDLGIDVQVSLVDDVSSILRQRKRSMAGPVGCGLCGIESIDQAMRTLPKLAASKLQMTFTDVSHATAELQRLQVLHRETRAVHAAGLFVPRAGIMAIREDVGRHNALDKLCGFALGTEIKAENAAVVVTSRISVEMVQKTAILGCPILIAVSAPTALAIRTADTAGVTLIGIARGENFEIFTNPYRIVCG